jgi:hypothetical protein
MAIRNKSGKIILVKYNATINPSKFAEGLEKSTLFLELT